MNIVKYENNWMDLKETLQAEDILELSSLLELATNEMELKERFTYCSEKNIVLKVKESSLESDVYMEILTLLQRCETERKERMHEAQHKGIMIALQKKESGEGSYGRPRVKLPKNFTECVEDCLRNGQSLESYRKKIKMKKSTFYKYAHIIKQELLVVRK